MRRREFLVGTGALCLGAGCGQVFDVDPIVGRPEIAFEDRMPAFFLFWEQGAGLPPETMRARFEAEVMTPSPELYAPRVLGEGHLEGHLDAWLERLSTDVPSMRALHAEFIAERGAAEARFTSALPDFDWRGRVVLYPSVGAFVGAARMLDGQPAILLGLDTAATERRNLALSLHHELFHMYQVPGGRNVAEALWVEGLATYAALALSPGHSDAEALPASRRGQTPVALDAVMPGLAGVVGRRLREVLRSPTDGGPHYAAFFDDSADTGFGQAGTEPFPTRSGFWFGLAIVRRMARGRSLRELAALDPSTLVDGIAASLDAVIGDA